MTPDVAAAVLNVDVDASKQEILRAFKLRARMSHPDRFAGAPKSELAAAAAEFMRVSEARDVLVSLGDHVGEENHTTRPAAENAFRSQPQPASQPAEGAKRGSESTGPSSAPSSTSGTGGVARRKMRAVGLAIGLSLLALFVLALGTAERWEKVDVAEHKATFHTEEFLTGEIDVRSGTGSPCWVGQDWTDCVNAKVSEYNGTCAGVVLSVWGKSVCDAYRNSIEDMKGKGGWGYYVSSLGGYGYLDSSPVTSTRKVSNNDYWPAVTHEAVCYLGFIGECKEATNG